MEFKTPASLAAADDCLADNSLIVVVGKLGLLSLAPRWQPLSGQQWQQLKLALSLNDEGLHWLGHRGEQACYTVTLALEHISPDYHWVSLREVLAQVEPGLFEVANRAVQISHWDRDHRYCGHCGTATEYHRSDRARCCPNCQLSSYPRISPCIIVLIKNGPRCLLARNARTQSQMFSVLAGFVEAGESAEQCLHREVFEEAGIKVHQLRYFSSQAWPFPGQLMLGFTAEYLSGELNPAEDELADAAWFHYQDLPLIPPNSTVSGQLIESFCRQAASE